jgi:hypothetical protein
MIVRYKRADMIAQAIGCTVLAIGSAWAFAQVDIVKLRILFGVIAVTLPVVAIALGIRGMGDLVALDFDERGVTVCTLWKKSSVGWANVKSIQREEVRQSSGYGLFKRTIGWYLVIVTDEGDGFEQRLKLNEKLLDWPKDSIDSLVAQLAEAQQGGFARRASASPVATSVAAGQPAMRQSFGRRGL